MDQEKVNEFKDRLRALVLEKPAVLEEIINIVEEEILNIKKQFKIT